jgi:phage tail-like protein
MPTAVSPIRAKPAERDPLRNFKFTVRFYEDQFGTNYFDTVGFVSVSGLGITTEVIPYREGGDNTITRKMPGQSDVGPVQFIRGVFMQGRSPQYEWFKRVFSVMWGQGNTGFNEEFRMNATILVLKHPVTRWVEGGEGDPHSRKSAGLRIELYNLWPQNLQFNDLNAGDNSIMVETMTVQYEGFQAYYGPYAGLGGSNLPSGI